MLFEYDKCGVLNIRNGKVCKTSLLRKIPILDGKEGYKHLGILESSNCLPKNVKDNTNWEYLSCIRKILRSNLTGHNTMTVMCAYTVPVMRYTLGVIKWSKGELQRLGRKQGNC
eukprot:10965117-Ditylum_brightwellii.AAC.1